MLGFRLLVLLCLAGAGSVFAEGALSNRRAPGFSIPDSTMKQHDPQDYRGKLLIIDVMQTHCPTCKTMSSVLEQVRAKYGTKIAVLSLVVPPDNMDHVKKYVAENGVGSPILFDCGQVVASYLKITPQNPTVRFPHIFFVDQDGFIRNDFDSTDLNGAKGNVKAVSAEIDKILAGAAPKKR